MNSAKTFDEKGHRSMALSFYLTGKERSGVVGVKVEKVIYFYSAQAVKLYRNYIKCLDGLFFGNSIMIRVSVKNM